VLKDGNNQTMHQKVFIIDRETVITGSMNPTGNGDKHNDENVLIIHDPLIAEKFMEEYGRVRGEAEKSSN
jgi:phosphatidylserine/phosphatidylglycerophosphate/cardiolipin synthase-like enzyme